MSKQLWVKLINWLSPQLQIQNEIDVCKVLFGTVFTDEGADLFELLILLYKRYIYVQRCKKRKSLYLKPLVNFIKDYCVTELEAVRVNKKYYKRCSEKWKVISHKW